MARVYNFSAGPAVLPEEVLRQAASEMLDYRGCGMSVMEMSHRSAAFKGIIEEAEADLRELLGVPENYRVLFLQGGATLQFAAIPMNLMRPRPDGSSGTADYIVSGHCQADDQQKIKIDPPAHQHRRNQIRACKYMGEHRLIHQLCYTLRPWQRKHIYRNIDGRLQKDHFHGAGSGLPEPQIHHIRQNKYAAPLQKSHDNDSRQPAFVAAQPGNCLPVASYKPIDLLLPGIRRFPDFHADKKFLKEQRRLSYDPGEEHYPKDKDDQDHIEHEPQEKQREIMIQFPSERAVPERQDAEPHNYQDKFIDHRYCHKHDCAVGDPVPILIHIIKLYRLAACCRRRDARVEKTNKRILNAPENTVFLLPHGVQQEPDHTALRADEKNGQQHRRDQIGRRHLPCRPGNLAQIPPAEQSVKGQNHHRQKETDLKYLFLTAHKIHLLPGAPQKPGVYEGKLKSCRLQQSYPAPQVP